MNILFLTISKIENIDERGIYTDLIRKFKDENHNVFVVSPVERRYKLNTHINEFNQIKILNVKTLNFQKTNIFEKGFCTLFIDRQYSIAIKKYFYNIKFDLVLYSTPPITFTKTIAFVKNRDNSITYLLLKDIFPQNAIDLGILKKYNPIYLYFKNKEQILYNISDHIGCLSPANVDYLINNNKKLDATKIEVNPNTIIPLDIKKNKEEILQYRKFYNIPNDSIVFIYGGNLGKPQGIDFLVDVLESNIKQEKIFFLIVGSGTEFHKINTWLKKSNAKNVLLLQSLKKSDFDKLLRSCDIGLIFLDKRFTIPNFPSRLLSYLESKIPILAATDKNTDLGKIIVESNCGFWLESGDIEKFNFYINKFLENSNLLKTMGENGYNLLIQHYNIDITFNKIISKLKI